MKRVAFLLTILFVVSCSDIQLVDYWKSPDADTYSPIKVLVVGLTADEKARLEFENQMKTELELRGVEVQTSADIKELSLDTGQITEEQLDKLEDKLLDDYFDTIILSKVIGVEDKIVYRNDYKNYDQTYRRFKDDYLRYQDIYYNPEYYNEYTVYHAETAMYCICPSKDRELLWKGYIDITDPNQKEITKTIKRYVNVVILSLEEMNFISPKSELIEDNPNNIQQ
ncbi:hypothetical protein DFQ05_2547 [Winogradskyella wandonensis]|uniref:Cardiolipin synthetase n=1 Tax=Winogradskyella wandonensis TaxID=1442586 RepID=A0A4R1KK80_9FLAO|nr:hypothetical protein [Winogradskyella wandonensis]TCK64810.1 hypothetical protein DFQ05_2547 [Winogradskyella wandonensis]